MHNQISSYLDINDLHCSVQSGYKRRHSCETALTKVVNDMLIEKDANKMITLFLLDLSAAFDALDHTILLRKLQQVMFQNDVTQWQN